jgi:hypothetical protein
MINNLLHYLDLQSKNRQPTMIAKNKNRKSVSLPVIPQYIALVSGITIQPFLATFQKSQTWDFNGFLSWLIFALIIAVAIFPAVYRSAFDPSSNLFVQLCTIFSSGIGWQSLFATTIITSSAYHLKS